MLPCVIASHSQYFYYFLSIPLSFRTYCDISLLSSHSSSPLALAMIFLFLHSFYFNTLFCPFFLVLISPLSPPLHSHSLLTHSSIYIFLSFLSLSFSPPFPTHSLWYFPSLPSVLLFRHIHLSLTRPQTMVQPEKKPHLGLPLCGFVLVSVS